MYDMKLKYNDVFVFFLKFYEWTVFIDISNFNHRYVVYSVYVSVINKYVVVLDRSRTYIFRLFRTNAWHFWSIPMWALSCDILARREKGRSICWFRWQYIVRPLTGVEIRFFQSSFAAVTLFFICISCEKY